MWSEVTLEIEERYRPIIKWRRWQRFGGTTGTMYDDTLDLELQRNGRGFLNQNGKFGESQVHPPPHVCSENCLLRKVPILTRKKQSMTYLSYVCRNTFCDTYVCMWTKPRSLCMCTMVVRVL